MDFKENGFFTAVGAVVILVILGQSVFFLVKAWKRGKEIGITASTMKNTVISSALFTVAPAFAIVATVLALSNALGLVVPWIRLSVIGNISQETTAASAALETVGGNLASKVEDPYAFGLITWVMTLGSALPLILLPLFLKKLRVRAIPSLWMRLRQRRSSGLSPRSSPARSRARAPRGTIRFTARRSATAPA